ncbi:MAG: radical SAM protein, partial [Clostridiales bacterium]|nr:radical SAM protein [Clostridiales bacterium]
MVHLFRRLGNRFCLDVPTGSLFAVDELTYRLIENRKTPETPRESLPYPPEAVAEANAELDRLVEDGVLFSPEVTDVPPRPSGVVKALCLNVTHACNLQCRYCFAEGGSYGGRAVPMTREVARAAIDLLLEKSGSRKHLEVDFFGGEPLLNLDVVKDTVAYAREKEKAAGKAIRFTLTTNATLLDESGIEFLNREMSNVVLSLDGRREVHDAMRPYKGGKGGSYADALEKALRFRAARGGKDYYVRGTFTALNLDFASDVLALND